MAEIKTVNSSFLLSDETEKRQPMCFPIINYGEISMFYAPPGIGKTWLALYLALTASSGGKFLKWQFKEPVKTLYLDGEMGEVEISGRIKAMSKNLNINLLTNNLDCVYPCKENKFETPNISLYENQRQYVKLILEKQIKLVIIDNLSSCSSKTSDQDNEFHEWGRLKKWLVFLKSNKVTVILVHHTNKGGLEQAGTSERERLINLNLFLSKSGLAMNGTGTSFDIEFEKARSFYGDDTRKLNIELQDVNGSTNVACFDWEEKAISQISLSMKIPDIMTQFNVSPCEAKKLKSKASSYHEPYKENEENNFFDGELDEYL